MIDLLICDDSEEARLALRTMLADHDEIALVGEAANGDEAVALALSLRPDVVLMDLHMPIVDGSTLRGGLRSSCPPRASSPSRAPTIPGRSAR